nr:pentatricopeptide repeat-containing protein At1g53600, mitochondrial [Tanacetum cinerariifolium]
IDSAMAITAFTKVFKKCDPESLMKLVYLSAIEEMLFPVSKKGLTEKSVELFNLKPHKDDIAWTALIFGFVSNGEYEESIHWFIQILQTSVKPNALTCNSVLSSSASLAT